MLRHCPIFSPSTTAAFISNHKMPSEDFSAASTAITKDMSNYCMTPGCIKAASDVLENMDESVNPCHDFYQFACGGFIKKTVIPEDRTRMSTFSVLSDELLSQVMETQCSGGCFHTHSILGQNVA